MSSEPAMGRSRLRLIAGGAASSSLSSASSPDRSGIGTFLLCSLQNAKKLHDISLRESSRRTVERTSFHRDLFCFRPLCRFPGERTASEQVADNWSLAIAG